MRHAGRRRDVRFAQPTYARAYGCAETRTPNFTRLAARAAQFDTCYAGSLPCMPARRELHTGRYNFLHRSWGPVEPFDDSMPEILKRNGVYTHLVSDHTHYWEDAERPTTGGTARGRASAVRKATAGRAAWAASRTRKT